MAPLLLYLEKEGLLWQRQLRRKLQALITVHFRYISSFSSGKQLKRHHLFLR